MAAVLFFWPLAFAAFNHLHDMYPKWAMGDHQGAQYASERVKKLGKIALWPSSGWRCSSRSTSSRYAIVSSATRTRTAIPPLVRPMVVDRTPTP